MNDLFRLSPFLFHTAFITQCVAHFALHNFKPQLKTPTP